MSSLKFKNETTLVKQYERVWNNYLERNGYKDQIIQHSKNRQRFYDLICKHLNKTKRFRSIELGCGSCIDSNIIAKHKNSGNYFALDISKNSISLAARINKYCKNSINLLIGNTCNLPIKNELFDMVFSQGLVEHFSKPKDVLKEQVRILNSNGILIVNVPQKFTGYTLMKKKMMKNNKWELGWEAEFSYRELKKLGKMLGLTELEVAGYQYWKSWKEPAFVLKDLYDKFHRRNPLAHLWPFNILKRIYNFLWDQLEEKLGHYFLQNIIIVFQKRTNENTSC